MSTLEKFPCTITIVTIEMLSSPVGVKEELLKLETLSFTQPFNFYMTNRVYHKILISKKRVFLRYKL